MHKNNFTRIVAWSNRYLSNSGSQNQVNSAGFGARTEKNGISRQTNHLKNNYPELIILGARIHQSGIPSYPDRRYQPYSCKTLSYHPQCLYVYRP